MPVTLCPIAIVAGCRKCPAFKVCPLKGVIGDQRPGGEAHAPAKAPPPRRGGGDGAAEPRRKRKGGKPGRRSR